MKMKFQFKKILGISSEYILEHRILNAVIVVGIIVSFLSGILNYLTQTPVITVYGSFFIAIAYVSILLYSILSKNFLRSYSLIFGFIITVFAPVFWVINAGSLGTTLYFLILTLVLINITSKNNANIFFSIVMIIVIAILLVTEKNYPQIIIGYRTNEDRLIDIFVSILLVAAAIIGSLKIFMNIYRNASKTEIEQKILLNQEEEKFRKIVSALPQFISIWDMNMRCTYVSPSVQQLTGYTPEERISTNSEVYIVPESMARLRNVLMDAMIQEQDPGRDPNFTVTCELEQLRKDGSHGTFESTYTFLRDETGAPISVLAVTADISAHKLAEDALRRSEEQYRLLAENSDDVIFTLDPELRFTYISPSSMNFRGLTVEEAMQEKLEETMTPESLNMVLAAYSSYLPEIEQGKNPAVRMELELYRKDGSTLWAESSMRPMRNNEGRLIGYLGVNRDISERRCIEAAREEAVAALRRSEEQYRLLADNSDDVIWTTDSTLRFTYVSPSVMKMRGMTVEEAMNEKLEELLTPASLNTVLAEYSRYLPEIEQGKNPSVRMDLEEYCKDGSTVWVEASMRPMRDTDGHLIGYVGVTRDISERKHIEAAKEEAVAALRRSEEFSMRLIAAIPDIVIHTNTQGEILFINDKGLEVTGSSREDIVGKNMLSFIAPEDLEAVIQNTILMMEQPLGPKEYNLIIRGTEKSLYEVNGSVLKKEDGVPYGMVYIVRDISESKWAEEELHRSEEQYRLIAENSDDVIFTLDPELRFTYMSPSSYKLRGVTAEEAMLEKLDEIMTPESLNRIFAEYSRVLAEIEKGNNPTVRIEIEQYRKDRSTLWVEISIKTIRDDEGHLAGFLGVSRDISEHKLAEAAIQASEEKFRQIVENASDAIYRLSSTGAFTFINPAAELLLGYSIDDIQNHYFSEIIPDSHKKDVISFYADMSQRQVRESYYEFPIILKSGAIRWVGQSIKREENAGGGVEFLGIARDISERKQAEDALQASEEKFRQIVSNIPNAVSIMDMNLRFTYMSMGIQNILGYTPEEIMALPLDRILTPESLAFAGKTFQEAIKHNADGGNHRQVLILPIEYYHKNGSIVMGENTMTFLRNANGDPVGILSVAADISERKHAEAKLKEAKDVAEAANRSKSVFLANMSHEIRTPMNAILGFAQLMQRDPSLSTQSHEHLDIINRSGEHLLALINDILEMSKIEAGRTVFVPTTFDLHALLYDLERMFRLRTDAKNLRFLVEEVGHIPQWVITDEGKLRQVLINLLGNSVKFTEDGGISLLVGGKVKNADTVNLLFEVEDTGPGMADDEIGRLFQAFEQTRSGLKSGGTGLGLALSRGFIELMGGTISVTSKVGKGSIFRFNIPVQEDIEEHAAKQEVKQRVLCIKPGRDEIRILIADDRETNRLLLSQMLAVVGFVTRDAVNGAETVQMTHEWKPQMVLMDMAMPVMDGYEATRKIKESPDIRNTAIIAVTASAFEEDKQRILAAGADGYLSKPFKDAELFEIIGRLTGVEYMYEETGTEEKPSETADDKALMRKAVASLSPDIVSRLRNAVESADFDLLNELARQLAIDHPTFAQRTQEMASRYEYEALIEIFSSKEDEP